MATSMTHLERVPARVFRRETKVMALTDISFPFLYELICRAKDLETPVGKLIPTAGLISEELPDISSSVPSPTGSGIFVSTSGTQAVNVRENPDIDANIVGRLEPGMQSIGLSRTEASDWVLINLEGIVGWVSADVIALSEDINNLAVFEPVE